jgi:hypothetical protein
MKPSAVIRFVYNICCAVLLGIIGLSSLSMLNG